jgi:hypothetical protein
MSRVFISHSHRNNAEGLAIARWLEENGWADYFLDINPSQGVSPGLRWQEWESKNVNACPTASRGLPTLCGGVGSTLSQWDHGQLWQEAQHTQLAVIFSLQFS